ncbi:MAG TPA: cytochrome-c oxidase, cbb3-type subunit III [Rhodospirillales bacterium]
MADLDNERSRVEIDPVTGQPTTGHVWDGIRELNRPLPRWWLWTFYATIAWAAVYVVLYPAFPLITGATGGVLGYSTRAAVEDDIVVARGMQAGRLDQVAALPLEEIRADQELARFAVSGGRSAFLVNCVQCHGSGAAGSPGYANLNDDDWLWGGALDDIHRTIAFGVRSEHPETRYSEMPAFGADALLTRPERVAVTEYVLSLSGADHDAVAAGEGEVVFTDNCASCHGEAGVGDREFGAPALDDAIWLYGGDRAAILEQVNRSRHGVMPAWTGRLDEAVIKQLSLYVHSLGGGEAAAD